MAKKKKKRKAENGWAAQSVLVKKTHPYGQTEIDAEETAVRHAKGNPQKIIDDRGGFRVILRDKKCCETFRGRKHGQHVTVFYCKLKKGARKRKKCR